MYEVSKVKIIEAKHATLTGYLESESEEEWGVVQRALTLKCCKMKSSGKWLHNMRSSQDGKVYVILVVPKLMNPYIF